MAKLPAKKRGGNVARNPNWQPKFLEIFGNTMNISLSADGAGIDRRTVYRARQNDPEFAAAMDDAKEEAIERLEADAYERAKKMSDTLLIFLLKAHKPALYRERYEQTTTNLNIDWNDLTDDELARIAAGEQPARVLADRRR